MPCYNVEPYIKDAMMSVAKQNYENIELIMVNDGSTDNTLATIQSNQQLIPFTTKIISQENKGLSGARNTGLESATGKYVYFFDSDDMMAPTLVSECVSFMEGEQLDLVHFNCSIVTEEGGIAGEEAYFSNLNYIDKQVYDSDLFINNFIPRPRVPVWLYFYRKTFLDDFNLDFYPGLIHEDELFTVQVLVKAQKIGFLDKEFFIRRSRANSIMTSTKNLDKKKWSNRIILKELNILLRNKDLSSKRIALVNARMHQALGRIKKLENLGNGAYLKLILKQNHRFIRYFIHSILFAS